MFSCLYICFSCFSVFLFVLPYPCNVCSFSLLCFKFVLQDLFIFLLPCSSPLLQQQQQEQQKQQQKQQQEQQENNKHIKNNQKNQTRTRTKLLAAAVSILFFGFFALVKRPWRDHKAQKGYMKRKWPGQQVKLSQCFKHHLYKGRWKLHNASKDMQNGRLKSHSIKPTCKMEDWSQSCIYHPTWKVEVPKCWGHCPK